MAGGWCLSARPHNHRQPAQGHSGHRPRAQPLGLLPRASGPLGGDPFSPPCFASRLVPVAEQRAALRKLSMHGQVAEHDRNGPTSEAQGKGGCWVGGPVGGCGFRLSAPFPQRPLVQAALGCVGRCGQPRGSHRRQRGPVAEPALWRHVAGSVAVGPRRPGPHARPTPPLQSRLPVNGEAWRAA